MKILLEMWYTLIKALTVIETNPSPPPSDVCTAELEQSDHHVGQAARPVQAATVKFFAQLSVSAAPSNISSGISVARMIRSSIWSTARPASLTELIPCIDTYCAISKREVKARSHSRQGDVRKATHALLTSYKNCRASSVEATPRRNWISIFPLG